MTGDHFKKVQAGQPLRIGAQTFNTLLDVARDWQSRRQSLSSEPARDVRQSGVVLVRNDSGEDRQRFEVLAIDGPLISPEDNAEEFKRRVVLKGAVPSLHEYAGRIVVLLEPIAAGQLGRAQIDGVCPAVIDAPDGVKGFADVGQEGYRLAMRDTGSVEVLWHDGQEEAGLAIVRLGGRAEPIVIGELVEDLHFAQTAEIVVQAFDGSSFNDTGRTETVYDFFLSQDAYLPAGTRVAAATISAEVPARVVIAANRCEQEISES